MPGLQGQHGRGRNALNLYPDWGNRRDLSPLRLSAEVLLMARLGEGLTPFGEGFDLGEGVFDMFTLFEAQNTFLALPEIYMGGDSKKLNTTEFNNPSPKHPHPSPNSP
jgi:hypothetical protein